MTIRILIVDDHAEVRDTMRAIIENEGMSVAAEAPDGRVASSLYRQVRPDIVLMDLFMPELNGLDATREILRFDREAVVVATSGLIQASVRREVDAVGCRGFLPKPFDRDSLLLALHRALE